MNEYTVRAFASREQVTVRTVRGWISKGAIETRRTPGGGVRVIDRPQSLVASTVKNAANSGKPSR